MAKQIQVRGPAHIAGIMVESLEWFVQTHYPRGADECSIAAREALLDLASRFERELVATGASSYSSRIRAFLCQAVNMGGGREFCQWTSIGRYGLVGMIVTHNKYNVRPVF